MDDLTHTTREEVCGFPPFLLALFAVSFTSVNILCSSFYVSGFFALSELQLQQAVPSEARDAGVSDSPFNQEPNSPVPSDYDPDAASSYARFPYIEDVL